MKKSNRKIAAFLAVLMLMSFGLAACSSNEEVKYTISFDSVGGSSVAPITAPPGASITAPPAPTFPLYQFAGWFEEYIDGEFSKPYTFGTMPEHDVHLYASWTPLAAGKISFDSVGGSPVAPLVAAVGESVTAPAAPVRENFIFAGWHLDKNLTDSAYVFGVMPEGHTTLYASWAVAASSAEVVYIANGEVVKRAVIERGATAERLSTAEETAIFGDGYVLGEWKHENIAYNFSAAVNIPVLELHMEYHSTGLTFSGNTVASYSGAQKRVVLPSNITVIGEKAFYNQTALTGVIALGNITSIGAYAFYGCVSLADFAIPDSTVSIGQFAFYNCERLRSVNFPAGLTSIADGAFAGTGIAMLSLGGSVTTVGNSAFAFCSELREVTIGEGITAIGDKAFSHCVSLRTVALPASLATLGADAFAGNRITSITVAENNTNFAFESGVLYGLNGTVKNRIIFYNPSKADTSFTVVSTITAIERGAFTDVTALRILTIEYAPAVATESFFGALFGCDNLEELKIASLKVANGYLSYLFGAATPTANGTDSAFVPHSLDKVTVTDLAVVDAYAFYGCSYINTLTTGASNIFVSIGDYAFAYTSFFSTFRINAELQAIGDCAFIGTGNIVFSIDNTNPYFDLENDLLYHHASSALLMSLKPDATTANIRAGTTKISPYALRNCQFTSLVIPDSVTEIGHGALEGCFYLQDLTIPFIGKNAVVGNNYVEIATHQSLTSEHTLSYIFGGVSALYDYAVVPVLNSLTVTKGNDVVASGTVVDNSSDFCDVKSAGGHGASVPNYAFYLAVIGTVNLPANTKVIGNDAFFGTTTHLLDETENMPSSLVISGTTSALKAIGKNAFEASGIISFNFDGISTMSDRAFRQTRLSHADLSNSTLSEISQMAFNYCEQLATVVLPDGLLKIQTMAFEYAEELSSITFPSSLQLIDGSAFYGCTNLATADFANIALSNLQTIGMAAFGFCTSLTAFVIPKSVRTIGGSVFQGCSSLESVVFDDIENSRFGTDGTNVDSGLIGLSAFNGTKITSIALPHGTTGIDNNAFIGCTELVSITIGSPALLEQCRLSQIRTLAFQGCEKLTSVTIYKNAATSADAPQIAQYLYSLDLHNSAWTTLKFYVPASSLTAYAEANPLFSNMFVEIV